MRDHRWRPLHTIRRLCSLFYGVSDSEGGIGARLRDLRKEGYTVDRRPKGKMYEYKVTP